MTNPTPANVRISGWPLALTATVISMVAMTLALVTRTVDYQDTAEFLKGAIPWLLLGLVALAILWRWSGLRIQGPIQWSPQILWLVLLLGLGAVTVSVTAAGSTSIDWGLLAVVCLGTLIVGITEELAFRGLALNGLGQKISIVAGVFISSVLFGLFHSVNVIGGVAIGWVIFQVIFTTLAGIVIGWIYVFSGRNLLLVMGYHWLYDFFQIAPLAMDGDKFAPTGNAVVLVIPLAAIVLSVVGVKKCKGERIDNQSGIPVSAANNPATK